MLPAPREVQGGRGWGGTQNGTMGCTEEGLMADLRKLQSGGVNLVVNLGYPDLG